MWAGEAVCGGYIGGQNMLPGLLSPVRLPWRHPMGAFFAGMEFDHFIYGHL